MTLRAQITILGFFQFAFLILNVSNSTAAQTASPGTPVWSVDHHMHLASPELCALVGECLESNHPPAVLASDAVRVLDEAHVSKGVILSCAYLYGLPSLHLNSSELAAKTRRENEFVAAEVAKYPDRLIGFLSVDPLADSAIDEIHHWRGSHQLIGLKLHFTASAVDIRNASERRQVAKVIEAAAAEGLPMVIHLGGGKFNAADAEVFIRDVLPSAGSSWIQIAHAGGGLSASYCVSRPRISSRSFTRRCGSSMKATIFKSISVIDEITFSVRSGENSNGWASVNTCSNPARLMVNWLTGQVTCLAARSFGPAESRSIIVPCALRQRCSRFANRIHPSA